MAIGNEFIEDDGRLVPIFCCAVRVRNLTLHKSFGGYGVLC